MHAGRDVDALVAERVMGFTRQDESYLSVTAGLVRRFVWRDQTGDEYCAGPPRYSTDMAAAWHVVETLRLTVQPDAGSGGGGMAGRKDRRHHVYWEEVAEAETAPLAICLAALRLVGDREAL